MKPNNVTNIITSLHRLIEGGTPMLIANNRKQKKIIAGKEMDPLLLEITREWLEQ